LPWRGEGLRSFSPLTLVLSPRGGREEGIRSFSPLTLALSPGGERGYVLSRPSPWPSPLEGRGDTFFLAPHPGPLTCGERGEQVSAEKTLTASCYRNLYLTTLCMQPGWLPRW